jgi:hypothetical protein
MFFSRDRVVVMLARYGCIVLTSNMCVTNEYNPAVFTVL